jgi:hypothetical protein
MILDGLGSSETGLMGSKVSADPGDLATVEAATQALA